jgi:hypothetical protein
MEQIPEFKFTVDEQYENEKGIFTVLSIQKQDMVIRWQNGEEITTNIDLQGRIQKRKQREKIISEEKENTKKSRPRKRSKTPK